MRVENWNPNAMDQTFEDVSIERLMAGANVLRATVKRRLTAEIGKGVTTGISRPVYKKGDAAGKPWTMRQFGTLLKSVRVTQKKSKSGKLLWKKRNVRVYVGHYLAYYADIFEYSRPFMRPALIESLPMIQVAIGVKK